MKTVVIGIVLFLCALPLFAQLEQDKAYDEYKYKGWDNRDLAATVLGGVSIGITIDIFSEKKHRKEKEMMVEIIEENMIFGKRDRDW